MKEIKININDANQRLDKFLLKYMSKASKSFIYKMLRKKRIKYNGSKAQGNEILQIGDLLQLYLAEETIKQFQESKEIPMVKKTFEIIYEDQNLLLCNKPRGLLVHPDGPNKTNSLIHEILAYLVAQKEYNPELEKSFTPAICNRLDRNTSGIVIVGKNLLTVQTINDMIKNNDIHKYYLTIVKGAVHSSGMLKGYHIKDEEVNQVTISPHYQETAKPVETLYYPKKVKGDFSLLEVQIITGRTHQIRAHLASIKHPIIGDPKYGDTKINKYFQQQYELRFQLLHAYKIHFSNCPDHLKYIENKNFVASLPPYFDEIAHDLF